MKFKWNLQGLILRDVVTLFKKIDIFMARYLIKHSGNFTFTSMLCNICIVDYRFFNALKCDTGRNFNILGRIGHTDYLQVMSIVVFRLWRRINLYVVTNVSEESTASIFMFELSTTDKTIRRNSPRRPRSTSLPPWEPQDSRLWAYWPRFRFSEDEVLLNFLPPRPDVLWGPPRLLSKWWAYRGTFFRG
jgi:hypothetical protein